MSEPPTGDGPAPAEQFDQLDQVDQLDQLDQLGTEVRADPAGTVDGSAVAALIDGGRLVGIGTDLVDLDRFRTVLDRTPGLVGRVFTDGEQTYARRRNDPVERFGARFAAKEATMKALGVGLGEVVMRDIEVIRAESGEPSLRLHGTARSVARARGVQRLLITMSHTDHLAQAVVVALGDPPAGGGTP